MTVPLGKPLQFTDEELDKLSQVSDIDIEKAKQLWRIAASDEYKELLDAQVLEDVNAG